jgi:hypothetical protein
VQCVGYDTLIVCGFDLAPEKWTPS